MAKEKFIPKASIENDNDQQISRGKFVSILSIGWFGFIAGVGGFFTWIGRMFFPNVSFDPPMEFKIGFPDDFTIDMVDLRFKKQYNVWIVRDKKSIYALSTVCTHLGCTPNWLSSEKKFYSESQSRFVVSIDPANKEVFKKSMQGFSIKNIGEVREDRTFTVRDSETIISTTVGEMDKHYKQRFKDY